MTDSAAIRPEYRYIVVPRGGGSYGVRDRVNASIVAEHLTREEARRIVWDKNGRHGTDPSRVMEKLRFRLGR